MSASVPQRRRSEEVQSLDRPRRPQLTAQLKRPTESNAVDADRLSRLGRTAKAALTTAHGSGQAAAIEIGMDQSQMNRQFQIGTFDLRTLSLAGDQALAIFGEMLLQEFGAARKSKKQLAREFLPQMVQSLLELTEDE